MNGLQWPSIHLAAAAGISLDGDGQQELVQGGILAVVIVCHCSLNGRATGLGIIGNVVDVNFGGRVDGGHLAGDVPDLCGNLEVTHQPEKSENG